MSPASQSNPDDGALAAAIAVRDEIIAAAASGVGRTTRAERQGAGAYCGDRAPPWPQQRQQWQAAVERRTGKAAAPAYAKPAREFGQEERRTEGPQGGDAAQGRKSRRHRRPFSPDLLGLRRGARGGDDRGLHRSPGVRPPRAASAVRHRTPRSSMSLRIVRRADPRRLSRGGCGTWAIRPADHRIPTLSAALPNATGEALALPFLSRALHKRLLRLQGVVRLCADRA